MARIVLKDPVISTLAEPTLFSDQATPTKGARIVLDQVAKAFRGGAPVLAGIDLRAAPGDFVSLIGPSGCGKSTLLKIIAGLTPVSSGLATVDEMKPEAARRLMSFIFQDATLLPWRTVFENVALSLELDHAPSRGRKAQVTSVLEKVGLLDCARKFPRQLSGGMKMRVSIARALVTAPKILLMDEPFGALDEMTRDRLHEELLRLKAQQKWTAFFVTHSVSEAVFLSNRVVVLGANPGRVAGEIAVPFAYPRAPALRSSPEFLSLVGQVSEKLRSVAPSS